MRLKSDKMYRGILTKIADEEAIEINGVLLTDDAINKMHRIEESEVNKVNQTFFLKEIVLTDRDYLKIEKDKLYRVELCGIADIGENYGKLVKIILDRFYISFNPEDVDLNRDNTCIQNIKISMDWLGMCSIQLIDD